jgi:signal transduction histidine kinase
VDDALTALRALLGEHGEAIVDAATAWVRQEAHEDLAERPEAETRGLISQAQAAYAALLLDGDPGPRDRFMDAVTSSRSNLKFRVSTLLRGFMGFRQGVEAALLRAGTPPALALEILRRIDAAYAETSFRTADTYVEKLSRVLDETREELIRKDKLAALGGLVAGVAHEISTPLGVAVTAASLVGDRLQEVEQAFAAGTLRRGELAYGLTQAQDAARMTLGNLRRASELVRNFKQIAVDQASEARRTVSLGPYLRELVASLGPLYRRTPHRVHVVERAETVVHTHVGAVSQVCTNLLQNALMHAFPGGRVGTVAFEVDHLDERTVVLACVDDGVGMEPAVLRRIYEPFFTTQRGRGGSGLGMHIVHNLVTDVLGGGIAVDSVPGEGTRVKLRLPVSEAK